MALVDLRCRELLTFSTDGPFGPLDPSVWRDRDDQLVGRVSDARVRMDGDRVVHVGAWDAPPPGPAPDAVVACGVVTPALVDCHTHAIFAGTRVDDFVARNAGVSYAEILEAGGGIVSSMRSSRAASDDTLARTLRERLNRFAELGVYTVEVKTGYGLSVEHELRHLRIIRDVAASHPVEVVATCLSGHAFPPEFRDDPDAWIDAIVTRILPVVADEALAEQVDVFCDRGALTVAQSRRVLEAARDLGFGLRVHAEELAHTGATALACALGAASADHLEHITAADVAAMAEADVAAVLLPLVTVHLDLPDRAPARALADAGVRVAVSTDYNPGSANGIDLLATASLACSLMKLTPGEALRGITRVAADVVARPTRGRVAPGSVGPLLEWDVDDWAELTWTMGAMRPSRVFGAA